MNNNLQATTKWMPTPQRPAMNTAPLRAQFITFQKSFYAQGVTGFGAINLKKPPAFVSLFLEERGVEQQRTSKEGGGGGGEGGGGEGGGEGGEDYLFNVDVYEQHESEEEMLERLNKGGPPPLGYHDQKIPVRVEKKINSGNFGAVFLARFVDKPEELLALKLYERCDTIPASDRINNELTLMAKAWHPNILHLRGALIEPPYYVSLTDFMEKGNLYDVLHTHKENLSFEQRLQIAIGIAKGMGYVSKVLETIHRDLKPANIMLDSDYTPKVSDFGESVISPVNRLLDSTEPRGTPVFMAPEIFKKQKYGHMVDVYSFGILCWELFSGMEAYKKEITASNDWQPVVDEVANKGKRPPLPWSNDYKDDREKSVAELMQQCWNGEPNDRPQWDKIVEMLEGFTPSTKKLETKEGESSK